MNNVQRLGLIASEALDRVQRNLPADYQLTLLCRSAKNPQAHILFSPDSLDEIIATLETLRDRPAEKAPSIGDVFRELFEGRL